jgi:hypothetical protein
MADYECKSTGMSLIKRVVRSNLNRSAKLGTPPAIVSIPFAQAKEMVEERARWDKHAKRLEQLGQSVEEMLYAPNVAWDSKQKRLKRLVNDINSTILMVRHL